MVELGGNSDVRLLDQIEFDSLNTSKVDVRPFVAEQVWNFIRSKDFVRRDTEEAKAEEFLKLVEQKKYAAKTRKRDDSRGSRKTPPDTSLPYLSMLKNWGRKDTKTGQPNPGGSEKYAQGVFYFFLREVGNPFYFLEIAKNVWDPQDLAFQKLYCAKSQDGPNVARFSQVCERYRSPNSVIRREFKETWIGPFLGPPPKVRLGPISISIGYVDGQIELETSDVSDGSVTTNGELDIFKALNWRSRLSQLHGRQSEFDGLLEWALAHDENSPRRPDIMLVSGPGGSGKSRLVADVVDHLVGEHGWAGGILPRGIGHGEIIGGSAQGVALIIDYPEERTEFVAEILTAARNRHEGGCPVRIVLVSREGLESWKTILNEPNPHWISEIFLGGAPYLTAQHATGLIFDVLEALPSKLGVEPPVVDDVDAWLKQHYSHRLPLIALAAAVHAVLDPDEAFCLGGDQVLLALAEIEIKRVRKYSDRDLNDKNALGVLLAISLLTDTGLGSEAVFSIGNTRTWPSHNGASLLNGVQATPFWVRVGASDARSLQKFEPDVFAAAFLYLALKLAEPLPFLPSLIRHAMQQSGPEFASILARVSLDLGHVSASASRLIEEVSVAALDESPDLVEAVRDVAYAETSTFSAIFVVGVCKKVLNATNEPELRAALQNSIANRLSDLSFREEALLFATDAAKTFGQLSGAEPELYRPDFAMALNNLGNRLSDVGEFEKAVVENLRAVDVYQDLVEAGHEGFLADLANALHNLSSAYSDLRMIDEAKEVAQAALQMRLALAEEDRPSILSDLAMSNNNLGNILADHEELEEALEYTDKALEIHQELAVLKPETYRQRVANSLVNLSIRNGDLMKDEGALQAAKNAVHIYEQLAELRPDSYLEDLAGALNNLALRYTISGDEESAIDCATRAIEIFRPLAEEFPEVFAPDLALSLNNLAASLINLEAFEEALPHAQEAVSVYDDMEEPNASRFVSDRAMAGNNLSEILSALGRHEEALKNVTSAEATFRDQIVAGKQGHLSDLALTLSNACAALSGLKRSKQAVSKGQELVRVARQLADSDEDTYGLDLAISLNTLARLQMEAEKPDDAVESIAEAMRIVDSTHIDRLEGYSGWVRSIREAFISSRPV